MRDERYARACEREMERRGREEGRVYLSERLRELCAGGLEGSLLCNGISGRHVFDRVIENHVR